MKVISQTIRLLTLLLFIHLPLHSIAEVADTTSPVEQTDIGKININTADASQLANILMGIGQSKAEAIIRYRENYGPFVNIDELKAVKGIGTATIEKNVHLIVLK